ncbi:hypothetical protein C8Q80DRAFT_1141532 [Daedaleopsis nitida]|nr:hypothetical protein C8Q80DRAFT_1141532 [Daedaleopsis nitida]
MSLPTPPSTSHRDEKENRAPRFSRVSWSDTAQYHAITTSPLRTLSTKPSASKAGPSRSILKRTPHPTLPSVDEDAKEATPEPEDPLADLHYLDHPVARIIASNASLQPLIQAYSDLTARLRNSVSGNTDADASWPLFQPLRKHREAFVQAVVRGICQVFVDPLEGSASVTDSPKSPREPRSMSSLPSPRESPKRRKRGMSEEQVKRARDLCGVCHAVLRLLSVVFTIPALYNLFDEKELGHILTQVLAIPMAQELPTPNARKTCALAIWLIQIQRLPVEVLDPARDRIAYALRRGIEGELGKEGKKGSQTDGLKAIHDLALYQPTTFVPAFAPLLGPILNALLAPTLVIRNQACHALGGLALAAASLPPSEAHTRMATTMASRLTKLVDPSPTTPSKKRLDASPSKDTILVRTLRTTLQATDPKHAAQGPVWAFSVIAHIVVLLGPTVFLHSELTRTMVALFSLGMRHTKSSVRALGCLAWRSMTWAFFRHPHVKLTLDAETDGEEESATEDDLVTERKQHDETLRGNFKLLPSLVDMGAGVSTVGALLGQEVIDDVQVQGAMRVMRNMSRKGGQTCKEAMDLARHLLGAATVAHEMQEQKEWDHRKLLAPDFFSANPGLLTAEWKSLSSVVKPLLEQCPQVSDVRTLSAEEISADGMWDQFLAVWKDGLSVLRLTWGSEEVPSEVREIWFNLLKCNAAPLLDNEDQDGLAELAVNARDVLINILDDPELDFTMRREELGDEIPTSPVKPTGSNKARGPDEPLPESRWNYAVKLFLVRDLFTITRAVFPPDIFAEVAESVLRYLNVNEENLVGDVQCSDEVREQWASLCAEAVFACDTSIVHAFWENSLRKGERESDWDADVRGTVWQAFLERWYNGEPESQILETAIVLLSAPFLGSSSWDMSNTDVEAWDTFLRRAIDAALDHGIDTTALVDQIAGVIAANSSPVATSTVRVADLLLSNIEITDARQVPREVFDFTNDTLQTAYPPAPRHKVMCMWLVRTLTRVIDGCPQELSLSMLELLEEGLRTWFTDEYEVFTEEEYSHDILPLYQTVLLSLQALPTNTVILETLGPVLASPFYGRRDKHTGTVDAFEEFWQATYAELPEPASRYSEAIAQCLDAVAQAKLEEQEDEDKVENMTVLRDDEIDSPTEERLDRVKDEDAIAIVPADDPFESEDEGSVVIPSPGTLAQMSLPLKVASAALPVTDPNLPSTPKTSPRRETQPSRPHNAAREHGHLPEPSSPTASSAMDSAPIRAPTTAKRSPAKSHSRRNKENASPLPPIATVTERLAIRSPLLLETILGKRPRFEDADDVAALNENAFKKGRLEASPLAPSAFSNVQVHMALHDGADGEEALLIDVKTTEPVDNEEDVTEGKLVEDDASSVSSEADSDSSPAEVTPTPVTRKRKGVFLDAVEVPSVEAIVRTRRRASMEAGPSTAASSEAPSPEKLQPVLRRTRSSTRSLGKEAEFQRLNTPKRRRVSRATQLREEAALMSSPLRSIRDAPQFGSGMSFLLVWSSRSVLIAGCSTDDSIMLASPPAVVQDLPPSDDDPLIGQVTPHRLVSPALRRVQAVMFDSDPPSDDSNMSDSPTSARVSRKIARLASERLPRPMSLATRSRSLSLSSSTLGSDL